MLILLPAQTTLVPTISNPMENEGKGGRKAKLSSYRLTSECAALPQSQAAGFNYQYLKVKKPMKKFKTDPSSP
jgi:hypothetical protein